MDQQKFKELIAELTAQLEGRPLGPDLDRWLNEHHGVGSPTYEQLRQACIAGKAEGWMCQREAGGIRFGRVLKAADELHRFSVDVVEMADIAGPAHSHPGGEIDLIMPIEGDARFDGRPAGWCVYRPGTIHSPTVSNGRAFVLYLLPEGQIDFNLPKADAHA